MIDILSIIISCDIKSYTSRVYTIVIRLATICKVYKQLALRKAYSSSLLHKSIRDHWEAQDLPFQYQNLGAS